MTVQVFSPAISVVLKKTTSRDQSGKSIRYSGPHSFDLKPLLTEDSSVTISRQINAPAGTFQISVGDRGVMHDQTLDSLYGIAEPMDVIEIRMARNPHEYTQGKLPLVFRGVISEIRRDESIGQDGKPRRTVVLAGHDWGKFLQIIQIKYIKGNPLKEDWLSGLIMQTHFAINYGINPAGTVISDLTKKVANTFLARYSDANIVPFLVDVSGADPNDKVMPQPFQAFPDGTLWDYFQTFGDIGPFYELFIDDTEDGPKLVYRKPPYFTADGDLIYGALPDSVNVATDQIQRLSVSRGDADVANWFWVDLKRLNLMDGPSAMWIGMGSNPYNSFLDSPNTAKELYGVKFLEVKSNHGFMHQGAPKEQIDVDKINMATYITEKIRKLKLTNQDNVVFETGSMVIAGNEKVKVGTNVRIQRGHATSLYYAQSVTHTFQPFKSFTTAVNFIRGTGFVNRSSNNQLGISAPYLQEIGHGPYESMS